MRYFALGNKANVKITDDSLTLEDVRRDAIKMGIVTEEESGQIREIERDEFIKPIRKNLLVAKVEKQTDPNAIPSWQSIVDELRINSTQPMSQHDKDLAKKKKNYGR
jgi:hypothetical protein